MSKTKISKVHFCLLIATSPRPMSRERERRTSTRLHRGIPTTGQELQRDGTRMSAAQMQSGMIPGMNQGVRRGSASKDGDGPARASSSRHVRKWCDSLTFYCDIVTMITRCQVCSAGSTFFYYTRITFHRTRKSNSRKLFTILYGSQYFDDMIRLRGIRQHWSQHFQVLSTITCVIFSFIKMCAFSYCVQVRILF